MIHIYIDEAGRWPLAWPVYVGLVVCKNNWKSKELQSCKDSKKISHKQREILFEQLKYGYIDWSYAKSSSKYIDRYGIVAAIRRAIIQGMRKILCRHCAPWASARKCPWGKDVGRSNPGNYTVEKFRDMITSVDGITLHIDGNTDFGLAKKFPWLLIHTYIKGDDKIPAISAASIIAKVLRDREMISLHKKYPSYGFAQHKGYGTQKHRQAIKKHKFSPLHRKTFCKSI